MNYKIYITEKLPVPAMSAANAEVDVLPLMHFSKMQKFDLKLKCDPKLSESFETKIDDLGNYNSFTKYLNYKAKLDHILTHLKLGKFDTDDIAMMRNVCLMFNLMAQALDIIQGEETVFCGTAIPLVIKLKARLNNIISGSNLLLSLIKKKLYWTP